MHRYVVSLLLQPFFRKCLTKRSRWQLASGGEACHSVQYKQSSLHATLLSRTRTSTPCKLGLEVNRTHHSGCSWPQGPFSHAPPCIPLQLSARYAALSTHALQNCGRLRLVCHAAAAPALAQASQHCRGNFWPCHSCRSFNQVCEINAVCESKVAKLSVRAKRQCRPT